MARSVLPCRRVAPALALLLGALSAVPSSAFAERLRFEGEFNIGTVSCDARAFECLDSEWQRFVAQPIAPLAFSFTLDVTQLQFSRTVASTAWTAPSLVPHRLIDWQLDEIRADRANDYPAERFVPFDRPTFESLNDRRYRSSVNAFAGFDGTRNSWTYTAGNGWSGLVPPSDSYETLDQASWSESLQVQLTWRRPEAGDARPTTFAELVGVFDDYLASGQLVDMQIAFGARREHPDISGIGFPVARMAGSFRLASIQCRTPSAMANVVSSVASSLRQR